LGNIQKKVEKKRKKTDNAYNKRKLDGFNLLKKWVPGTKRLSHPHILKKTVNYIKELLNKVNEKESAMECTPQSPKDMGGDSVPKITLHYYGTEQDSALREPHSSPTDISEVADFIPVKTFATTPAGASMRKTSCVMDAAVQTTSEAESDILSLEEELLGSLEEELLGSLEEELLVSPEEEMELLASGEELPELNWTEDLRQWLEL
jgi:hypothetical protein